MGSEPETRRRWGPLLSAVLLCSTWARASEGPDISQGSPPPASSRKGHKLQVSGRLLVRGLSDERLTGMEASISSAKLRLATELTHLDAVLSADLANHSIVSDAFVRLHDGSDRWRLWAGRFKAPFFERQRASRWELPLVSRGLLNDYLVDQSDLGGRRLGLMADAKLGGALVALGAFQGSRNELGQRVGVDASSRVSLHPLKHLRFGASGYWAQATGPAHEPRRVAAGPAVEFSLGPAALQAEGLVGTLPAGEFTAGTAMLSYDVPFADGRCTFQPIAGIEGLQLREHAERFLAGPALGHAQVATLGMNVLYLNRAKGQLQVDWGQRPGELMPTARLLAQVGARF